ncbi:efflux RND transporter periplasmic adaptor subunit [Sphingomonas sp. ABOLD]|uniref:Multidrug efflux system membrane fusion protein n=1 Tax=Sphingomonas trueperi TaxID=53317 RepID=A0A7X5Y342_9SPHN|nr:MULTISPECIES: efflux RND transporter periplasmic adaptor subunit [Sphingomonas]NJB99745.1 multidrug efflux system membrane fusion protein [Sphingomonas trueperi]RSV33988.1 efflux RND transporter periplasmic adaptor subunit [Sphingomonas sp. ABOLE]RSV42353.1 efflux RND transporter periplasmic adaptor subunit [Sphingomonas sp. ABOLD]
MTDQPRTRRTSRRIILIACAVTILLIVGAVMLVRVPKSEQVAGAPPRVGVARAARQDVPQTLSAIGTVQPVVSATVRAQLSGTIFAIDVKEGQMVAKGQRLAQIDPRPYRIAIAQAQGNLARDMAQLANARLDLARYQRLLAQNSIARQQVDSQQASVRQLEGTVTADRAAVDNARLNLRYTDLVAPVAGRVGLRKADIGTYVSPSDSNGVFVVTVEDPIDVSFAVPQAQIGLLMRAQGAPVRALDQASSQALAEGSLLAIDNQADPATGTVTAKARFANASAKLFPNQFVNVSVRTGTIADAVTVPVSALRHGDQGDFLFVVGSDKVVHLQRVKTGPSLGNQVAILSGITAGETVVSTGADALDDGMKVAPLADLDAARK